MTRRTISNLALYVDVRREMAVGAAKTLAALAKKRGVALQVEPTQAKALSLNGSIAAKRFPRSADLVVSLGGDGTLLQAAHLAGPLGVPIVGVNFGSVGFLTEVIPQGYKKTIEMLLARGFVTEPRLALEARVIGGKRSYYAVNDVHIDRKHHGRIVNFDIYISGENIATIPADGIIVAS